MREVDPLAVACKLHMDERDDVNFLAGATITSASWDRYGMLILKLNDGSTAEIAPDNMGGLSVTHTSRPAT